MCRPGGAGVVLLPLVESVSRKPLPPLAPSLNKLSCPWEKQACAHHNKRHTYSHVRLALGLVQVVVEEEEVVEKEGA